MATLTGCGGSDSAEPPKPSPSTISPSDMTNQQRPPTRLTVDVAIKGGAVTPHDAQLQAKVSQPIVVRVNSDAPDELHVRSDPEHTFKVEPKPGQSFQFTLGAPGPVDIVLNRLHQTIATVQVQQ